MIEYVFLSQKHAICFIIMQKIIRRLYTAFFCDFLRRDDKVFGGKSHPTRHSRRRDFGTASRFGLTHDFDGRGAATDSKR